MSIRLLALDIDGTLTNQLHEVSDENTTAIRRACNAGVFVTIATGRGRLASTCIADALRIHGPVVHYGGAWIVDTPGGETLKVFPLEPDVVHQVLLIARELKTTAQIYQEDLVLVEYANSFSTRYVEKFRLPLCLEPHALDKTFRDVPKMLLLTTEDREEEVMNACAEMLGSSAEVSRSQRGFIEINCVGVNKATGLVYVAEMLDIMREEIAAIGDSYLDMEMMRWAGIGACVENGVEAARDCADVIIPSCDDNGVARFIEQYIL